jgi:hypothetical protein
MIQTAAMTLEEAATTITALREALKPFAEEAETYNDYGDNIKCNMLVAIDDLRAARKAYEDSK